jgi:hypothetical protein
MERKYPHLCKPIRIGDANAVGTITKATYQGHHAALDI